MLLKSHYRNIKIIFWIGQAIGCISISFLLLFVGANLIEEIRDPVLTLDFKEDYKVLVFFILLVLIAIAIMISWYKPKTGAQMMIAFTILAYVFWGMEDFSMLIMISSVFLSALLLLLSAYYKDWAIKKDPDQ